MKQTNDNETVREVCAKMLEPSSTCKACDFLQCPMLVKFSAEVKKAHECEMDVKDAEIARLKAEKKCDWNAREIALLKAALKPVMDCNIAIWADASNAVREAQRVMREGGEK